jgi:hypothetical protein
MPDAANIRSMMICFSRPSAGSPTAKQIDFSVSRDSVGKMRSSVARLLPATQVHPGQRPQGPSLEGHSRRGMIHFPAALGHKTPYPQSAPVVRASFLRRRPARLYVTL